MNRSASNCPLHQSVKGAFCILLGILSAMSFAVSAEGYVGMSDAPASATSYVWGALAICFALLLRYVFVKKRLRLHAASAVLAVLFGVVNVLGGMLFAYDSWDMLANPFQLGLALLRSLGQSVPMAAFFTWLHHVLTSGVLASPAALDAWQPRRFQRLWQWACRHEILAVMAVYVLCWSPYLLAFYPGTVCWDLGEMVAQFFGQTEMDTWHPVFTTWVMGSCVWLGRLFGSDNLGAALFTLLQTTALSYALARSVQHLRQLGLNRMVRLCAIVFFALVPFWAGYAQFVSKDTLYTSALLLFALNVLGLLTGTAKPRRAAMELFIWGLLSCLFRSNGLYVVLPTALMAVLLAVRGRNRLTVGAGLAGAVACAMLFSNVLIPALGIRDETASGIYSACFQQSARVLRDHADTVTPEEYAAIDFVLDAKNLPELYEPWISDPVKYTFRQYGQGAEAEKEALARYRKTWLSMLPKYPLTYLESFFAGSVSYYCFTPKMEGETYNNQAGNRMVFETYELGDSRGYDLRFLDTTQIGALAPARTLLALFARGWRHIPLLGMLYVCPVYTWLLVGAGLSAARQKRWRLLIVGFLPALLSLGVCMLGPVNDYFRYFLPIVAMTIPLLGTVQGFAQRPISASRG